MSSEVYPLANIREEASSSGLISRQASDPTLNNGSRSHYHHAHSSSDDDLKHDDSHPPPSSPHAGHLARRMSRASRVSVDFFDPEGMAQLQRTLTSGQDGSAKVPAPETRRPESVSSYGSDHTLTVDPDHFDLEKTIRQLLRRYAFSRCLRRIPTLLTHCDL